jgi:hypothetical protein
VHRDNVHLWGRDIDYDDWVRGSYGSPRFYSPQMSRVGDYQDREGWQRSPNYAWQRGRGHWHGQTPLRGFRRSDERIFEDVCSLLCEHPRIDTSDMDVSVHGGEVTLEGSVDDRWEKRLAEDLVETVAGVREVHNRLRTFSHQWSHAGPEIRPGMRVVGIDGQEIGRVKDVHGHEFVLLARTIGREVAVPLRHVQNTIHDQVVLTIRGDEVESLNAPSQPPPSQSSA